MASIQRRHGLQFQYQTILYYDVCTIIANENTLVVYSNGYLLFRLKAERIQLYHQGIFIHLF